MLRFGCSLLILSSWLLLANFILIINRISGIRTYCIGDGMPYYFVSNNISGPIAKGLTISI